MTNISNLNKLEIKNRLADKTGKQTITENHKRNRDTHSIQKNITNNQIV